MMLCMAMSFGDPERGPTRHPMPAARPRSKGIAVIDHLDHLVLTTDREAECIRFYTEVLGIAPGIVRRRHATRGAKGVHFRKPEGEPAR